MCLQPDFKLCGKQTHLTGEVLFWLNFCFFMLGFSGELDSHVSLTCFFLICVIATLTKCFDLRFRNKFSKITIFLMCYIISVFKIFLQIYLMFTFLAVLCNLISVKGLMISCCQTTVWVLWLVTLKE